MPLFRRGDKKKVPLKCGNCIYFDREHSYCMKIMAPVRPDTEACKYFTTRGG